MSNQINKTFTLLFIIFSTFFSQRVLAQPPFHEDDLYVVKDKNGKAGIVNIHNEVIVPFEYDDLWPRIIKNSKYEKIYAARSREDGKYYRGFINVFNQEIVPFKCNNGEPLGYGIYLTGDDDECGLIDSLGTVILPNNYDYKFYCGERYIVFTQGATYPNFDYVYGVFDLAKKDFAFPCRYKMISPASGTTDPETSEYVYLIDQDDKVSIVRSKDLKQITKYKYDNIEWGEVHRYGYRFSGGLAIVKRNGKYGAINESGKEVIPVVYDWAQLDLYQEHGAAILIASQKTTSGVQYICFNVHGKPLLKSSHRIYPLAEGGVFWGSNNGHEYYLYDYNGVRIGNTSYQKQEIYATETESKFTIISKGNALGVVSDKGIEIIPCRYEDIKIYCEIAMLKNSSGWQIYDLKRQNYCLGHYFKEFKFEHCVGSAREIKENIVYVYDGNGWGIFDVPKSTMLIPCLYDEVDSGPHQSLYFENNGKYGLVNRRGDITDIKYSYEEMLDNGHFYLAQAHFEKQQPDVDTNIPVNIGKAEQTFAVIIANEKYSEMSISDVPYASKDGAMFKEYCRKTLGIPNTNIKYRENATFNQIRYELNWLKDIAEAYNGQAKIIFYYAGHGIPNESNSTSYILPSDGFGSDVKSAYSLNELYAQLGELPAKQVTVFMDACFSGAKRDGKMLTSARGVAIHAKSGTPKGNMVVFSAAQGDETAYQYNKKKHGMFTYFLLKKLQETKGEVTLEELGDYLKQQVQRTSMKENNKLQTPTMQVSPYLKESIKSIHL